MSISVKKVNYNSPEEAAHLLQMLQAYALDEQGGGEKLKEKTVQNLIPALKKSPIAVSFLAYKNEKPIGLANCFYAFSTFEAQPILNIHDLVVLDSYRGKGIGSQLLSAVEKEAKENNCCKITLEVLQQNTKAQGAYKKFGFAGYNLGSTENTALFWQKKL